MWRNLLLTTLFEKVTSSEEVIDCSINIIKRNNRIREVIH